MHNTTRILVTGGAGYVGSTLVRYLLDQGYRVRVLDSLMFTDQSLNEIHGRIELVRGDIQDVGADVFDGIDGVIHLAGFASEPTSQCNPRYTDLVNHIATERLARMAKANGVGRFVFASSCSVYFTYNTPLKPPRYKETEPVNPISPYSLSKRAAEQAMLELSDDRFVTVIFRKGTVVGLSPRMRYDLIVNSFTKDAFTRRKLTVDAEGQIWRPLVDIQDVAWAYARALELPPAQVGGRIFNVVDENWNILALAQEIKKIVRALKGAEVDIEVRSVGTTRNYRADNSSFREVFGFKPRRELNDAVAEIWNHLEKNPEDAANPIHYNDRWQIQQLPQ